MTITQNQEVYGLYPVNQTSVWRESYQAQSQQYPACDIDTVPNMLEDDSYRTSSQFRYWSYTKPQLDEIRTKTNELAAQKVNAALHRAHDGTNGDSTETSSHEIDTLTIDEELQIVRWGCSKIIQIAQTMEHPPPFNIVATAIQYLRRFYLTNSPMTYHPKQIMVCAFYLALKSEHYYTSISKFVSQLSNVTEDDVRAPEFLLMQGLRFTLDVRHPMRGLDGGIADIRANASKIACFQRQPEAKVKAQIDAAYYNARQILKGAAQMTDAYFLYTPPQIWLASLHAVDQSMAEDYIDFLITRLVHKTSSDFRSKLLSTITECTTLLKAYTSPDEDKATEKELRRIGKKLTKCQDPEKLDIVSLARAKAAEKRDGGDSDRELKAKKRKMEREKSRRDEDVFGGELKHIEV